MSIDPTPTCPLPTPELVAALANAYIEECQRDPGGAGNMARRPIPLTNAERNRALVARQAQRRNNQPLVELSLMWLQPAAPSATHGEAA